jgi:hypothetical protein
MPMQREYLRRTFANNSCEVVELLTTRQFLHPHLPLTTVLQSAMDELGCCPAAIQRALEWLQMDPALAIGRLRRSELIQLGKSIHRFWRQAAPEQTVQDASR